MFHISIFYMDFVQIDYNEEPLRLHPLPPKARIPTSFKKPVAIFQLNSDFCLGFLLIRVWKKSAQLTMLILLKANKIRAAVGVRSPWPCGQRVWSFGVALTLPFEASVQPVPLRSAQGTCLSPQPVGTVPVSPLSLL